MGKRKSRQKPAPKKKPEKLDKEFACPFCGHTASVECKIYRIDLYATASCFVCSETFSTAASHLTEPVDVYSEWIDECHRVNTIQEEEEEGDGQVEGKRRRVDVTELTD